MSTQMQLKKIAWLPGLLKREKNQQSLVFSDVIFDVYTHVDNRERARETNSLEENHENFIAVVRKWEMLAASWKWAAAKNESKHEHRKLTKSLVSTYDNIPP